MRRVVLLALLALALPAASLASTVDYGNAGLLGNGASMTFTPGVGSPVSCSTASNCVVAGGTLNVSSTLTTIISTNGTNLAGSLGTVSYTTGPLMSCGAGCFTFTGGTINVWDNSKNLLFQTSFSGTLNVILTKVGYTYMLVANQGGLLSVGFQVAASGAVSGNTIVTPEPGTLGLLGTGLVGLAGLVRRKMRA